MPPKKGKRGLLRKPKTITGSNNGPKSLKPQQARQLIRRFHVLQKNKAFIINRINEIMPSKTDKYTEQNYLELLRADKPKLMKIYDKKVGEFTKYHNELIKIDSNAIITDLISILAEIDAEVEKRGGLKTYQTASTLGQNSKRGGDSSKRLIEWLNEEKYKSMENKDRVALEIGCLSKDNLISTSGVFKDVTRIDLNSQGPGILEQNFMERPLPKNEDEKFHLVSCSLVLNFVPSAEERGEMLIRITKFLKKPQEGELRGLFLVLPLPCVSNSRYCDNDHLNNIMVSLGFTPSRYYEAKKVAYWLYDWEGVQSRKKFAKSELHSGANRNNFCVVVK